MVKIIEEQSALEAWQEGSKLLLSNNELYNLITVIKDPVNFDPGWMENYNPKLIERRAQSVSEVASTIFPYKFLSRGYAKEKVYSEYLKLHARAKKIHPRTKRSWGTYFQRMISFGGNRINQLDIAICSINGWTRNHKAAIAIHVSSADMDSIKKTLGNPCLQYVELLCPTSDTISLLAVYRNHDYFGKVLGNFIGLGQLLRFVCQETGRMPDSLVCHSAHAYYEGTKSGFRSLAQL